MADQQQPAGLAPPKKEEKKGLFTIKSSKPKKPEAPPAHVAEISALSGRIRVIEERLYNLRRKTQLTDQNMLNSSKKFSKELKDMNNEIKDLRMDMEDLRSVIHQIISEMKKFANKDELNVLKKYIDFWEPLKYTTPEDVERIVDEKLKK